jgi:L-rhamnose isomerase
MRWPSLLGCRHRRHALRPFPGEGEPRNIFDKLDDCAVIQELTRATPTVSLHIPWDKVSDLKELKERGAALGLGFDAMNSNTFSDAPQQEHSYKFGSLSHMPPRRASRPSSTIWNASPSAMRWAPRR